VSDRKKRAFYQRFLGRELQVLVQGREPDGLLKGLSRNYIPVALAGEESLRNSEILVRVTEVARESVRGERVG